MESAIEVLQTKLDKSKAFMDSETFVFLFKESKPFAIHKNQLFKNQLYDETIDEYGHTKYTRKNSSVIKKEKLVDLKLMKDEITNYALNGAKYDGGVFYRPFFKLNDGQIITTDERYSKEGLRIISDNLTNGDQKVEDGIKDYCFFNGELYILTINGVLAHTPTTDFKYSSWNKEETVEGSEDKKITTPKDFKVSLTKLTLEGLDNIIDIWYGYYQYDGIFILTSDGVLTHYYYDNINSQYKTIKVGENYYKIKEIRSFHDRTFMILKDGRCYACGDNASGALGVGSTDAKLNTFEEVGSKLIGTTVEEKYLLRNFEVEDVGIGKYHTVFLLKDGTAIAFGANQYKQLDPDEEKTFDTSYKFLKYGNLHFKEVKCTSYGTIFNTYEGSFVYLGVFLSGELGIYTKNDPVYLINDDGSVDKTNIVTPAVELDIDENKYTKFLKVEHLTKFIDSTKIKQDFIVSLYNTYYDNVWFINEDMQVYCNGKIYDKFGMTNDDSSDPNENTLTALPNSIFGPMKIKELESHTNPVIIQTTKILEGYRSEVKRQEYWSYYYDVIAKLDNKQGGVNAIYFKMKNGKWIDWNAYVLKYMYVTLKDGETTLPKTESIMSIDDVKLDTHLNYNSFAKYLENNPSIGNEFVVPNRVIPAVNYIDEDLKVWNINAGDNMATQFYTDEMFNNDTKTLQERKTYYEDKLSKYEESLKKTEDVDEITTITESRDETQKEIDKIDSEIEVYRNKIGTICKDPYFDFAKINPINPIKVVGTEQKDITYTRSIFEEPDSITGLGKVKQKETDGVTAIVKETSTKNVTVNKTRIGFDFVSLDYIKHSDTTNDSTNMRDDIKLTLNDDPDYPDDSTTFQNILLWMSGRFINKDYFLDGEFKQFCIQDGKSLLTTRRICEYPDLGEPRKFEKDTIPTIQIDTATVIEPTYPTELRWDINLRAFSWDNIKIKGPYKIHNGDVSSELSGIESFYFGDVYVQIFTKIRLMYRRCEKNTFLLFLDGAVVPDNEYSVDYNPDTDITTINLHTYSKYVLSTLQEQINVNDPGYEGHVRQMINSLNEGKQFSIAFLESDNEYKKVKLYYDRDTVRNYPKPGNVMFRNVSYNDLILVDGFYLPYLWESKNVIRYPEYTYSFRSSINDYIIHSDIYRVRPFITYKREDEMTDTQIKNFALEQNLISSSELADTNINDLRKTVKTYLNKLIKDY